MALLEQHDLERYRQFVADVDMPDSDKDELIGIVVKIMAHFVDAAFGETSEQIILDARADSTSPSRSDCGKLGKITEKQTVDSKRQRIDGTTESLRGRTP